jgi:UPF0755 protein
MPTAVSARLRVLWPILLALLLTAVGVRTYLQTVPADPPAVASATRQVIYIKPKTGVEEIARMLRKAGVIRSSWAFMALAYLQGSLKRLHAGEYEFSLDMPILDVLRKLEEGRVITHQVTIPEGFTAEDIARLLASEHLVDPDRFMELVQDSQFVESLGVSGETLEGYLFPDTYRLTRGMREEEIIRIMVARFHQALPADFAARAEGLGLDLHEAVTLASLVEKEATLNRERPIIAAVFYNRLRRNMPLQSDPSAVYRISGSKHSVTARDLQRESPYNTYLHTGLPPGPIASPGLSSLLAVLNPPRVSYLYFVARNDGSHYFSYSLEEHTRAVRLYQNAGRRQ